MDGQRVDLVALAELVRPLIGDRQVDSADLAGRVAAEVVSQLMPIVARIEAAVAQSTAEAARSRRGIGPFVPPPSSTAN